MNEHEIARRADQWIEEHEAELVRDLRKLVDIRSVSAPGEGGYAMGLGCKECADALMDICKGYGFEVENDDYYSVSAILRGKTDRELGILGHMDVVPEGTGWHYEPYRSVEKDGYVIGRGSSDNKGPTVMSLYVLRCLRDLGIELNHTVRVIAGFNEEAGMQDVEHYLKGHTPPEYTIVCDGGWAMCIGEKGILTADLTMPVDGGNLLDICGGIASNSVPDSAWAVLTSLSEEAKAKLAQFAHVTVAAEGENYRVSAVGKAAHAFTPHQGANAIYRLLEALCESGALTGDAAEKLAALRSCFVDDYGTGLDIACEDEISGKTTCIGGMIRMRDGRVCQNINVRYAIEEDSADMLQRFEARCAQRGLTIENLDYSKPRYTSPELPTTKLLLDTCHEFLEVQYEPYVMGGGTHARKFPNALPYGPAIMDGESPFGFPHGIDEAVSIDTLKKGLRVYVVALMRLDAHLA